MPRKSDNSNDSQMDNSQPIDSLSQLESQAEATDFPAPDYSPEQSESTATTSPAALAEEMSNTIVEELAEEASEILVQDLLSFREQVWALVGKKLRARIYLSSVPLSASPYPDGSALDTSYSEVPHPVLPDAIS